MQTIKFISLFVIFILPFLINGCDTINKLPINVPVTFNFQMSGAGLSQTRIICMDEADSYLDYKGDIKKLSLLRIIYRTDASENSVLPENIQGFFQVLIKRNDTKEVLIDKQVPNLRPSDYKKPHLPYELILTSDETALVNMYLNENINENPCFEATVTLLNITGGSPPYYLNGHVDVLIEAEVEF